MIPTSLKILQFDGTDLPRMRELMRKYHELPTDLADAGLVRIAEKLGVAV